MDLQRFSLPDITPKFDFDAINRRQQELLNSITPLSDILAEEIRPILAGNERVVAGLNENYSKLNELYLLKEKELENSKQEADEAKKHNTKMMIIALISAGIALASLVATILIAVL